MIINDIEYYQTSIFLISIILAKLLNNRKIYADACAGLSLGEYTALCYADVLTVKDDLSIIRERARIIKKEFVGKKYSMLAIINDNINAINYIIDGLQITNYNSYNQIVVTGETDKVNMLKYRMHELGIKCIELNLDYPFHSSYMLTVSKEFRDLLSNYSFASSMVPVYSNVSGDIEYENYDSILVKQLYSPLKFTSIIENMLCNRIERFFVIGVGSAIVSFIQNIAKKNNKKIRIIRINSIEDIEVL